MSTDTKTAELFDRAFGLHAQGQLDEAERLYKKLLLAKPNHADALALLGAIALVTGRPERAVDLIGRSLRINPHNPGAHSNLGYGLMSLGRNAEAVASCDAALALQPDFTDALNNRGNALRAMGRLDEALASFDAALALRPDFAAALSGRGSTLLTQDRLEEALASYDAALGLTPSDPSLYKNRGIALAGLERLDEALASLSRSLELAPDQPDVLDSRGILLCRLKRPAEALASFGRAIRLQPENGVLYNNRGNALTYLQRPQEAMASYREALARNPEDIDALNNLANAFNELDQPLDALAAYDAALALQPDHATSLWHKSLTLLALGRFAEGWPLYEARKHTPEPSLDLLADQPLWLGDHDLTGKTLLINAEQGLGDTLQFCRLASLVKPICGRVILAVPEPVHALIETMDKGVEVVTEGQAIPPFDYHTPLLSLPLALGLTLETLPPSAPYLNAPDAATTRWRSILPPATRPRIGLAWSGRAAHKNDYNRSMPLATILPLLEADADWFCLQTEIAESDRALLAASGRITVLADRLQDFSDTAAAIAAMDLVISVDTSVAHLAGAMGKPVWILLPRHADWRWLRERTDSPWYASARLFRQRVFADWPGVIADVGQALKTQLAG